MPRCKQCDYKSENPSDFPPSMCVYHDFQCPECGTTAIDTSDMGKDNMYGDGNTATFDSVDDKPTKSKEQSDET